MPDLEGLFTFIQDQGITILSKILLLLLILVYFIFTIVVATRVNTLNRTLSLSAHRASAVIRIVSVLFVLLAFFLFVLALVIV